MKIEQIHQHPCPACGSGPLLERHDRVATIGPKNQRITVPDLEYSACAACNATVVLPAQLRANKKKMRDAQATLSDYISPAQVLELRETYEISQQVAAEIFGGGRNAFSKYERGEVTPSASAARTMLRALRDPSFFATLAKEKGLPVGDWSAEHADTKPEFDHVLMAMPDDVATAIRRYSDEAQVSIVSAIAKFATDGVRSTGIQHQKVLPMRVEIKDKFTLFKHSVGQQVLYLKELDATRGSIQQAYEASPVPNPIRIGSQHYERNKQRTPQAHLRRRREGSPVWCK
ncbi:type II TA system antitoxin MqsA family protein [Paraburkholderia bryophila]|uniref:Putative zinc finger/helix-turn-helix YgiT family protein n=1 Tax=Paraburkholderia bryophila TaxID=420952 RepID=A0A7Z0AYZ0_9BURK|nr:type II TA system antitoxin MqsA family protein [Paraburkholderia bryophila]NYH13807.1 putative zinc finger/helix-turn-helix YgiT family protein [Paraburkholderia bryophila]